jgi:hypothetical protein
MARIETLERRKASSEALLAQHLWGYPNLSCGCGIKDGREIACREYIRLWERAHRLSTAIEKQLCPYYEED